MAPHTALHAVDDQAKVAALAADMQTRGWVGAPVIVWGEMSAITGTHRLAAAQIADIDAPELDITEVFAEAGMDLAQVLDDLGMSDTDNWYQQAVMACNELPTGIRTKYGIDIE